MSNDELAVKLSNVEGLLTGMAKRFERMENALDNVVAIDRTVAEHSIRIETLQKEVRDAFHDIKNCEQRHISRSEVMQMKIEALESDRNKTLGAIFMLKVFSGVCVAVLAFCGQWLYERAEGNRNMNIEQQHEIRELKQQVAELRKGK